MPPKRDCGFKWVKEPGQSEIFALEATSATEYTPTGSVRVFLSCGRRGGGSMEALLKCNLYFFQIKKSPTVGHRVFCCCCPDCPFSFSLTPRFWGEVRLSAPQMRSLGNFSCNSAAACVRKEYKTLPLAAWSDGSLHTDCCSTH